MIVFFFLCLSNWEFWVSEAEEIECLWDKSCVYPITRFTELFFLSHIIVIGRFTFNGLMNHLYSNAFLFYSLGNSKNTAAAIHPLAWWHNENKRTRVKVNILNVCSVVYQIMYKNIVQCTMYNLSFSRKDRHSLVRAKVKWTNESLN